MKEMAGRVYPYRVLSYHERTKAHSHYVLRVILHVRSIDAETGICLKYFALRQNTRRKPDMCLSRKPNFSKEYK